MIEERDGKQTNGLTHICRARLFLFFYEVKIKSDGVSPSGRVFEMSGKRDGRNDRKTGKKIVSSAVRKKRLCTVRFSKSTGKSECNAGQDHC